MPFLFLLIIVFHSTRLVLAADKPAWIDRFTPEDSTAKYYVGRASGAPSDADAVFQATTAARKQAIGENFGVYVNFQSQSYRSMEALSATQSAQELSGQVRLEGFSQKELHFERDDGRVNAWVLFQYPKAEILKEKVRLERLRAKSGDDVFRLNEFGSDKDSGSTGALEIHSRPEGLHVRFDTYADMFGKPLITPLRIRGVDIGRHIVVIDDPGYGLFQKEVQVMPGTTASVDAVMERAFGTVEIKTNPDQATVSIGTFTLKSPTPKMKVPAGAPVLIQIIHPEAKKTFQQELTVSRNDHETRTFDLDLKPVLVSVNSSPEKAEILVDGVPRGETPITLDLPARSSHVLVLRKDGYELITQTLAPIPGGGTRILPVTALAKEEVRAPASSPIGSGISSNESDTPSSLRTYLGLRAGYSGSSIDEQSNASGSGGIFYEFPLNAWLGADIGIDLGSRDDIYSNGKLVTTKLNIQTGLPITLVRWSGEKSRFFIEPGLFYLRNGYGFGSTAVSRSDISERASQHQFGWVTTGGVEVPWGAVGSTAYLRINLGLGSAVGGNGITSSRFFTGGIGVAWGFE